MIEQNERVAVLETKVDFVTDQVQSIDSKLEQMAENSTRQHAELAEKIVNLEKINHGWVMWALGASAVISVIIGIINFLK